MNHSPELIHTLPPEVSYAIPTFAMPERNSCVPTVLQSVLGHFESTLSMNPDMLDKALDRKPEEAVTTNSFCDFLTHRGYELIVKQTWDDSKFVQDPYAYARRFYGMDTDQPRVSVTTFEGYYTEPTLVQLKSEAEVRLTEAALDPLVQTESGLPTHEDIQRFLAAGNLVTVTLGGSEETGTHFALVCGYTENGHESLLHVFDPDFVNDGIVHFPTTYFDSCWLPEDGIIAMRLP